MKKYETISVDIDENVFKQLALMAHEQDITFNQLCEKILQSYVNGELDSMDYGCCGGNCCNQQDDLLSDENTEIACCGGCCGKQENFIEQDEQLKLINDLEVATKDIIIQGVTKQTLKNYGYAFSAWCYEYNGNGKCTDIIQNGFDMADDEDRLNGIIN
jgi:hypothetical protein